VCVINWRSCLFRKACSYVVTLVCVLKTRAQCGCCIRTFLIFVTRAGISIKVCLPLLVSIITSERDFFIASHILRGRRVNFSCCWFIVEGLFLYCRSGCSCSLSNCRTFCCFFNLMPNNIIQIKVFRETWLICNNFGMHSCVARSTLGQDADCPEPDIPGK